MTLQVSSHVLDALISEARQAHPRECCGLMLGKEGSIVAIQPAVNVHPEPENQFEIDPQALIDAHRNARMGGPQVLGYYHSHPNGRAHPSAHDEAMATGDGAIWAIIAAGSVSFWRLGDAGFAALPYEAAER